MRTGRTGPRRVLILGDHLGHTGGRVHGVTTYYRTHLPVLSRAVRLSVAFLARSHPAAQGLEDHAIHPVFFGRSKWDPRALGDVFKIARDLRIELIHITGEKSLIAGGLVAKDLGIPAVVHLHDAIRLRRPLRALQRRIAKSLPLALIVSEELWDHAVGEYAIPPAHVRVLMNGIDLDRFDTSSLEERSALRAALVHGGSAPLIGVIGRITEDKGQLQMIEAMEQILAVYPDATLLIVGEGPARQACMARARALRILERVVFTGQRNDVPRILSALDLVVVPSICYEALPFVGLEALASARPVVAFDTGGIRNTVIHDRTGVLVKKGDVETLAREVTMLIGDPDRRARYGIAGREHARLFSIESHVARLAAIYEHLLS